tara:strand:+ start:2100 stop:2363 length:264 start_codon:yes stop_codon:yes gene_type:complete
MSLRGDAIVSLRPGSEWVMQGDELTWLDSGTTKPTESEIVAEMAKIEYKGKREVEYPSIADQLDMIYHDIDNWKATIKTTKDKYPKP